MHWLGGNATRATPVAAPLGGLVSRPQQPDPLDAGPDGRHGGQVHPDAVGTERVPDPVERGADQVVAVHPQHHQRPGPAARCTAGQDGVGGSHFGPPGPDR